ncbi:MAG: SCP2 sterol-binding domain-containing protein [Gammaproteobacteria bacterium]|nr:SCP2 sterol-binding domain-containing protein [Gammaproteobacteria bacterium]
MSELGNQLLGLAEIGGNRLLGMDPNVLKHCGELQGHIIAIELTDLDQTIYCHPGSWGLRLSLQTPAKPADATIKGRLMGLINLSLQQDKVSTSIQERVEISGNASVAQKFQKILTELDIDWEEQLSGFTGDVMAFRIMQGLRNTEQWVRDSFDSLSLSGREYLQEEARHLPTKVEFERFKQNVTDTRHDVDRLESRLNQLLNNKK